MEKTTISLSIEDDKLEALTYYLSKENSSPQKELDKLLADLYQQKVPADTREYLERKTSPRPKRLPRSGTSKSKAASTQEVSDSTAGQGEPH